MAFDQSKADAFANRMLGVLNGASLALMTSIGHRTGLFDRLAALDAPATSAEIARAAGLSERYVREWLAALTVGGVIEHDPAAGTYRLPPEHAAYLTRASVPNNLAVPMQWIPLLGAVEDDAVAAFAHGRGIPYEAYERFHEVMAEESAQTVLAGLEPHILGLVPGLVDRLERGIDVLDLGCGAGRAVLALAERFPRSRFVGIDLLEGSVAEARAEAARRRLRNARFEARDAAKVDDRGRFDLIFTFDAVHDQADPACVLENIARALRPDGVYVMQDIGAATALHENREHPLGPFLYTISCLHCMSVSIAGGGEGLGTAWGKELALRMLADAGFRDVRVETLPHDAINFYYVCGAPR